MVNSREIPEYIIIPVEVSLQDEDEDEDVSIISLASLSLLDGTAGFVEYREGKSKHGRRGRWDDQELAKKNSKSAFSKLRPTISLPSTLPTLLKEEQDVLAGRVPPNSSLSLSTRTTVLTSNISIANMNKYHDRPPRAPQRRRSIKTSSSYPGFLPPCCPTNANVQGALAA